MTLAETEKRKAAKAAKTAAAGTSGRGRRGRRTRGTPNVTMTTTIVTDGSTSGVGTFLLVYALKTQYVSCDGCVCINGW